MRAISDTSDTIRMYIPGTRTGKITKTILVSSFIIVIVLSSIAAWMPGLVTLFGSLFPSSTLQTPTGCSPGFPNSTLIASTCSPSSINPQSPAPSLAGANTVPNLSLPQTKLSSINRLIYSGGVVQNSPDNLTLYNLGISERLLGGNSPHDELLGPGHRLLGNSSSWSVETLIGNNWMPMRPVSNTFTVLGTNETGTYVVRTMTVSFGSFGGTFKIFYAALASGPLKWTLEFTPSTTGHYKFSYLLQGFDQKSVFSPAKNHFVASFGHWNYTVSWNDVPSSLNSTAVILSQRFSLGIDLGSISAGHAVVVDPTVNGNVDGNAISQANLRKIFYDSGGGNYFVFYYNGNCVGYSSSPDGNTWSGITCMPSGWPVYNAPSISNPSVYNIGKTVVVASGDNQPLLAVGPFWQYVRVWFSVGTISGGSITWVTQSGTSVFVGGQNGVYCTEGTNQYCSVNYLLIEDVSVTIRGDGTIMFSYNFQCIIQSPNTCLGCSSGTTESDVMESSSSAPQYPASLTCVPYLREFESQILPGSAATGERIIFQTSDPNNSNNPVQLSQDCIGGASCTGGVIDNTYIVGDISASLDAQGGVHLVYPSSDGTSAINYAYEPAGTSPWSLWKNIFGVSTNYSPTLTVDFFTNDVYVFGIHSSNVIMVKKSLGQDFSQAVDPLTGQTFKSPYTVISNAISYRSNNVNQIAIAFVTGGGSGPFALMFASIPLETVWSPYAFPASPWDGNGLAPYGQYFSNLGEYVSPSTGMLTIKQTDLSIPGRGLNLDITRVYSEPYSFLNGTPFNYDTYPWAPMGDGWQLNFPWMANINQPTNIHLWDGQGYHIPSAFWTGSTGVFENHQGENFRLVRNSDGTIYLYDKSGTVYLFGTNPNHALTSITDSTGSNTINFNYSNNVISCISDSVQRPFVFSYSSGLLQSISQVNGSCTSPGSTIRAVSYGNNGASLTLVTDPAKRNTTYTPGSSPWLISQITYPTAWFDSYTYTQFTLGTTAISYRVTLQQTMASSTSTVRQFGYQYSQGVGDQIIGSKVTSYNGTQIVQYTNYAFSFLADVKNVTDVNGNLLSGDEQVFGIRGEIPKDIVLVSDGQGHIGSYTNYHTYDAWGNLIYTRSSINPSTGLSHEAFSSYYNNGLSPGFFALQDSFSSNQGTTSDNNWNVTNGFWTVNNGMLTGTDNSNGDMESMVSYEDIGKADVSLQTQIYVTQQIDTSSGTRVGIFAHYTKAAPKFYKWALIFEQGNLELVDAWTAFIATVPCTLTLNVWYTLNMTVHGFGVSGWASTPGQSTCNVSGAYSTSSPAATGTAFGLYAGGYSASFRNVQIATVSQALTKTGFSNSFISNGAPGPNIHGAIAGTAQLTGAIGASPIFVSSWNSLRQDANSGSTTQVMTICNIGNGCKAGDTIIVNYWQCCSSGQSLSSVTDSEGNIYTEIVLANGANPNNVMADTWGTISLKADTTSLTITATYSDTSHYRAIFAQQYRNVLGFGVTHFTGQSSCSSTSESLATTRDNSLVAISYDIGFMTGMTQTGSPVATNDFSYVNSAGWGLFLWDSSIPSAGSNSWGWNVSGCNSGYQSVAIELLNGNSLSEETYFGYSSAGRVTQTKQLYLSPNGPQGLATSESYDSYGNLVQVTDARGNSTSYSYSGKYSSAYLTNQTRVLRPSSTAVTTLYGYNFTMGTKIWIDDPNGFNTTYQYDILGRTTRITYPTRDFTAYSYNDAKNYVDITDENGLKTRQIYDGLSRLSVIDRFLNGVSYSNETYKYNWQDKTTKQSDPLGNTYNYQYDALGRIVSTTKPDTTTVQQSYNDIAPWIIYTDESGNHKCDTFDRAGRLLSVDQFSDSNCNPMLLAGSYYVTTYSYDEIGNLLRTTVSYNYIKNPGFETGDFTGWTETNVQIPGYSVHTGKYSAMPTYSNGYYSAFTLQQTFPIAFPGSQIGSISFWQFGGCLTDTASVMYSDGTSSSVALPELGLNWAFQSLSFNPAKNIIGVHISRSTAQQSCTIIVDDFQVNISEATTFSYDNLNRLTQTNYPDSTTGSQTYDNNGNIVSKTNRNGAQTFYSYDALNRVNAVTYGSSLSNTYTYDKNGNLLLLQSQNATIAYGYDARNRVLTETYSVNTGYNITASPSTISILSGNTNSSTVTLKSVNGFSGNVALAYSAPSGITVSLSQTNLSLAAGGTATSTVTVSTGSSSPVGNFTLTLWGNSSGLVRSVNIPLRIKGFSLSVSPNPVGIQVQSSGSLTVTATNMNGYTESSAGSASAIQLSVTGLPSAVTASFTGTTTIQVVATTINDIYQRSFGLTIDQPLPSTFWNTLPSSVIGTSSGGVFSFTKTYTLTAGPHYLNVGVSAYTGYWDIKVYVNGVLMIDANATINTVVNLNFSPVNTSTLTISVGKKAVSGMYTLTVIATDGHISQITTIDLRIGSFALSATPSPTYGFNGTTNSTIINVSPFFGVSDTLTLSATGIPSCVSYNFSPTTVALPGGGSSTLTLNIGTTCSSGSYTITVKASGTITSQTATFTLDIGIPNTSGPPTSSPTPSITYKVRNTYNGELLNSTSYPDRLVVSYSYDGLGRATVVTKSGSSTSYAQFLYDTDDRPTFVTYGNGIVLSYGYTSVSTVSRLTVSSGSGTVLLTLSYGYIGTGGVASVTGNSTSTSGGIVKINEKYGYDALQRLTTSQVVTGATNTTASYSYDEAGNMQTQTVNGISTGYSYNAANNELLSFSTSGTSTSYSYDPNGNLLAKAVGTSTTGYTWDSANHLMKVSQGATTLGQYAYDGLDRRVQSVETGTVLYSYQGTETLSENYLGTRNNDYIFAGGLRIANVTGNTVTYYHADALGSTRLITDSSKNIIFSDSYQPFGQDNGTPGGSAVYKYSGKPVSQTTGLYYEYARWYDPSIGRFISQDPLAGQLSKPESLNLYIYAGDNPTTSTDPSGMYAVTCCHYHDSNCDQSVQNVSAFFGSFWHRITSLECWGLTGPVGATTGAYNPGAGSAAAGPAGIALFGIISLIWVVDNWGSISDTWRTPPPPPGGDGSTGGNGTGPITRGFTGGIGPVITLPGPEGLSGGIGTSPTIRGNWETVDLMTRPKIGVERPPVPAWKSLLCLGAGGVYGVATTYSTTQGTIGGNPPDLQGSLGVFIGCLFLMRIRSSVPIDSYFRDMP